MTNDQIKQIIKESFLSVMPDCGIFINNHALGNGFAVSCRVGKDKTEWANGIHNNDPLFLTIHFWGDQVESTCYISIKPPIGSFYYSQSVKLRKKTIKADKITAKALTAYFQEVRKLIIDNKDNWLDSDSALLNKKFA